MESFLRNGSDEHDVYTEPFLSCKKNKEAVLICKAQIQNRSVKPKRTNPINRPLRNRSSFINNEKLNL